MISNSYRVHKIKKHRHHYIFLLIISMGFVYSSCKTTKYVPEGSYLLDKVEVNLNDNSDSENKLTVSKSDIHSHLRQKENQSIFKFHLAMYNLSLKKNEDGWLKRIGEPPVIYDSTLQLATVNQINQYLNNKGYFNSIVEDTVFYNKRKRKVKVRYNIFTALPYTINSFDVQISDPKIRDIIYPETSPTGLIELQSPLDQELLDDERSRITRAMTEHGYYAFAPEYVYVEVDSTIGEKYCDLKLIVDQASDDDGDPIQHRQYRLNNFHINVMTHDDTIKIDRAQAQSIHQDAYHFYFNEKLPLKPSAFIRASAMNQGALFDIREVEQTYNNLTSLRQFKFINISFTQTASTGEFNELDCNIDVQMSPRQNSTIEIEGTNTTGDLGVAGNLIFQHKNLFRGAEIIDVTLSGAYERLSESTSANKVFNMFEYGAELKLTLPRFIWNSHDGLFSDHLSPKTVLSTSYTYQNQPNYTRSIVNGTIGYGWKNKPSSSHMFQLSNFNFVKMINLDEDFENSIENLLIRYSYTDHLIVSSIYTFTKNSQYLQRSSNYRYFRTNVELAGNVLDGITNLFNQSPTQVFDDEGNLISEYQTVLNTRYAQYFRTDFEYRYGIRFNKYNAMAVRGFFGINIPYGNMDVTPFEKMYFTGGANGIRAWSVRSLGPGGYAREADAYPNQLGDIKFEANIEYRYDLFSVVQGAFFVDVGNIWLLREDESTPDAEFQFSEFYKQIAVGVGAGIRLVWPYFIIRFDMGVKQYDPSADDGERWILSQRRFVQDDLNFTFAIGYPF